MPITAFIGVRISWLIVARNELLASLAASAAARASCACRNRRAFWIAITAWSAKVFEQREFLVGERPGRLAHHADRARRRGPPRASAPTPPSSCRSMSITPRTAGGGFVIGECRGCGPCGARESTCAVMRLAERLRERARDGLERRAAPGADVDLAVVAGEEDAELLGARTGAGSCRGSSRTPARCRRPSC